MSRRSVIRIGVLPTAIVLFLLATSYPAMSQTGPSSGDTPVIVRFRGAAPAEPGVAGWKQVAELSQSAARTLLEKRGVAEFQTLWIINGMALRADAGLVAELSRLPEVDRIGPDGTVSLPDFMPALDPPGRWKSLPAEWNLVQIGAPSLWDLGYTGEGVVVATLDSGVDAMHPDLASRWRGEPGGWFDPQGVYAEPHDPSGHGTQVMGLLLGGAQSGTAIGVAPGATWIAAKVFDDAGQASWSDIHLAFQWLLDPDGDPTTDDAPDVVNGSWGLVDGVDQCVAEFQDDVRALRAAGIAVVFAAGNQGPSPSTSVSPANYPESLAVGSVGSDLVAGAQSSRGPSTCDGGIYPELAAPGENVRTSDLTFGGIFPDSYAWVSGTSAAAPHVAGAIALLMEAFPSAGADAIETALVATASDLGDLGPDDTYGHGLLHLGAAFAELQATTCRDADGDGYLSGGPACQPADCDDANPAVWGVPGEVGQVTVGASGITWEAPVQVGGTGSSLRYDVLRSTAPDAFASATCVEAGDGTDTFAVDPEVPGHGHIFYYLVRAQNDCPGGIGSAGRDSEGQERAAGSCL